MTWEHVDGLCCDGCDVWHLRSCIEVCSADYHLLARHSHIQRLCGKCDSINVSSFTFHSFELNTSNMFDPLSQIDSSIDSVSTDMVFSPLYASSPSTRINQHSRSRRSQPSSTSSLEQITNTSSLFCLSEKKNLRIMNVSCRSIRSKSLEFLACLNYIKPDIACGTESWLKGMKPGKPTAPDAIGSSEVFPSSYKAY